MKIIMSHAVSSYILLVRRLAIGRWKLARLVLNYVQVLSWWCAVENDIDVHHLLRCNQPWKSQAEIWKTTETGWWLDQWSQTSILHKMCTALDHGPRFGCIARSYQSCVIDDQRPLWLWLIGDASCFGTSNISHVCVIQQCMLQPLVLHLATLQCFLFSHTHTLESWKACLMSAQCHEWVKHSLGYVGLIGSIGLIGSDPVCLCATLVCGCAWCLKVCCYHSHIRITHSRIYAEAVTCCLDMPCTQHTMSQDVTRRV